MGTDIYAIAEVKENGKWKLNPIAVFPNPYFYDGSNFPEEKETTEPRIGRHYDLFSVLANVRNGVGFAGIKTGDGFMPISQPKGFPADISEGAKEYFSDIETDSSSHLTIEELINFDWSGNYSEKIGYVTLADYKELRGTGNAPSEYWIDSRGKNLLKLSQEQANNILDNGSNLPAPSDVEVEVQYKWMVNYKEHFAYFFKDTLLPLSILREQFEDVRIVFTFG